MHNPFERPSEGSAERPSLSGYLTEMAAHLRSLPSARRGEELREVRDHLETAAAALRESGVSEDEAVNTILAQFGSAKDAARQFAAAWRRGERKKKGIVLRKRLLFGASLVMGVLASGWLLCAVHGSRVSAQAPEITRVSSAEAARCSRLSRQPPL